MIFWKWMAEGSAVNAVAVQAVVAALQAITTVASIVITLRAVRGQIEFTKKQAIEMELQKAKSLRMALYTEIASMMHNCIIKEYESWKDAIASKKWKNSRTAIIPSLIVYNANGDKIPLLSREEIMALSALASQMHDLRIVAGDALNQRQKAMSYSGPSDPFTDYSRNFAYSELEGSYKIMQMILANICGTGRDFMSSCQIDGKEDDLPLIAELDRIFHEVDANRDVS